MDLTLVQYKNNWYRWEPRGEFWYKNTVIQYFDKVVDVYEGQYEVIKDRFTGETGTLGNSDLMQMKMWASGLTLMDLPIFIAKDPEYLQAASYFKINSDGNLVDTPFAQEQL